MGADQLESTAAQGGGQSPSSQTAGHALPKLDVEAQVLTEQIRSVYLQSPTTTIGSLIVGAVLVAIMRDHVPRGWLIAWALVLCAHQALRVYHYLTYRRATPAEQGDARWGRLYTMAVILAGCIWGSAGALMFVSGSIAYQAILLVFLTGNVVVSMLALSAFAPAVNAFVPLTLLPFIVRALAEGDGEHVYLAIYAALVLIIALTFGRNMHRMIRESLTKRFENLELIDQLQRRGKELEIQTAVAEQARGEAEKAHSTKMQFFRAANHDLRQPLHALGMYGRALGERIRYPEVLRMVEGMNDSIRALENLFNALLDLSKLEGGGIEPHRRHFALRPMLQNVAREFTVEAKAKGLEFRLKAPEVFAYTDSILLDRVVRNLVSNAVRYTRTGGVLLACRKRRGEIAIEVWDTGPGIAAAERERIFEEFYQVGSPARHSTKGIGLGLSIVQRLTQLLGHKLDLASRVGRGTLFRLTVPQGEAVSVAAPAPAKEDSNRDALEGKLVLVIDDEPAILEAMKAMLCGWRCESVVADGSDAALEGVAQAGRYPDLFIADYRLQSHETGVQAAQRIRWELGVQIPTILITGSTSSEHLTEAETADCLVMGKPVLPEDMERLMREALKQTAEKFHQ
jgi:two-component system, sensor histidine kinase